MKSRNLLVIALLLFIINGYSQIWTKIEAKDGSHFITNNVEYIDFPILGTYLFKGAEPVVELNQYGTGFYQLHEQLKRPMTWGIECDEHGALLFQKGFDNVKYILWYQYTSKLDNDIEDDLKWKMVEFTIHFNTLKMFIQGERSKDYTEKEKK